MSHDDILKEALAATSIEVSMLEADPPQAYRALCAQLRSETSRVQAAVQSAEDFDWGSFLPLFIYRLSDRFDPRSVFDRELAALVDPWIRFAVRSNAVSCLQPLLAHGVLSQVSGSCYEGASLLHDAAHTGADRVVSCILDNGSYDIDARSANGSTPLRSAVSRNRTQAVALLLAAAADPSATNRAGDTPLVLAVRTEYWACVERLLEGVVPAHSTSMPMGLGLGSGKTQVPLWAHFQLQPCLRERVGSLFGVVGPRAARVLMSQGADRDCAAKFALSRRGESLLPVIREFGALHYSQDHLRAAVTSASGMAFLLADGVDPNTGVSPPNGSNESMPLIYFAATERSADVAVISLLLRSGALCDPPPDSELRPLLYELVDRLRIMPGSIRELVALGVPVNARDKRGRTALHAAVESTWTVYGDQVLTVLLDPGADANASDHHGCTPLMIAAAQADSGTFTRVKVLLDAGADATARDADGMGVLHHFFGSKHPDGAPSLAATATVELLIRYGADVAARNVVGQYADEVGDGQVSLEQRRVVLRIRRRNAGSTVHAAPLLSIVPNVRC